MKIRLIKSVFLIFLLPSQVFAQIFTEIEATPDYFYDPGSILLISEVNFKNKESDWIELYYFSPKDSRINLNGLKFKEDKIFKEITQDIEIESNNFLLLQLGNSNEDSGQYLYSTYKGLTGTTEQISILDPKDDIIDAVCWQNSSPTENELNDLNVLQEISEWDSLCINSEEVKPNFSIIRTSLKDTNSLRDWKISETPTPLSSNIIYIKKEEPPPADLELDDSLIFSEKTQTAIKNTDNSQLKSWSGNTQNSIIISEIMPNPDGPDTDNEWIEITNTGTSSLNLINWSIDDGEGGSKPFIITKNTDIAPGQTQLFKNTETKISLANKTDSVRLIDPANYLLDEISYSDAPSGQSYALINGEWIWTDSPTPNQINPIYEEISGTVTDEPNFEEEYYFRISDTNGNIFTILFNEESVPAPIAKATFKKGASLRLLAYEKGKSIYELVQFEVLEKPASSKNSPLLPSIILTTLILTSAGLFTLKKFGKL
jgi:hypothetical protein